MYWQWPLFTIDTSFATTNGLLVSHIFFFGFCHKSLFIFVLDKVVQVIVGGVAFGFGFDAIDL